MIQVHNICIVNFNISKLKTVTKCSLMIWFISIVKAGLAPFLNQTQQVNVIMVSIWRQLKHISS